MSAWPARFALGHLATASVVGIAGSLGALGSWWIPVGLAALVAGFAAAAVWGLAAREGTELSRLADVLDRRTWSGLPTVTSEA